MSAAGNARTFAWRLLPPLLLLAFYWPALTGWFFQDDFGWLRLRYDVHSAADLPAALLAPKAHGNMRPLGENAYWLVLGTAFGVEALPFRVVTFATAMGALVLLGAAAERLLKSPAAAWAAQVLWITSCGLAEAMGWSSIYNQVLSGFFFLLAFYFLLRHAESGEGRWWMAQWIAFLLGLGALETNIVYPLLAVVYAALYARPLLPKLPPLLAVALLAAGVHFYFAPAPHLGPYAPRVDARIFTTLWTYWGWALGRMAPAMTVALTAAALAFTLRRALRGDYVPLIGFAWFLITLAPYLPLPEHKMDYYLAVPSIGVALAGASAVAAARHARLPWKAAAAVCLLCYLAASGRTAWAVTRWQHDRGRRAEDFVSAVAEIRRSNPGKTILLDGMDNDLFWAAMVNLPFHAMRIPEVFLAPGGARKIDAPADLLAEFVLPEEVARRVLENEGAVVFRFDGDVLRNETMRYRAMAEAAFPRGTPRFVNIGDAIFADYLGQGWGPAADGYRAMRGPATLRIGGPRSADESLYIGVVHAGPFGLSLKVDGAPVPLELLSRENDISVFRAAAPVGRTELALTLETDLTEPLKFGFAAVR
ncbi:MAG TPA: hypothetical protein VLW65_01560 [Bryobacteraceae bacterium]|nr:hypothetical protein [Bryobacteraceae bacterium]